MYKIWMTFRQTGLHWLVVGACGAILVAVLVTKNIGRLPWRLLIVQSGSMEPAIGVGDLVVIKPQPVYKKGDVIAFLDDKNRRVTHRILTVSQDQTGSIFTTKGDANQTTDISPVPVQKVEGAVDMVLPYLGYVLAFGKTRRGMILMALIPVVLLITDEVIKVRLLSQRRSARS